MMSLALWENVLLISSQNLFKLKVMCAILEHRLELASNLNIVATWMNYYYLQTKLCMKLNILVKTTAITQNDFYIIFKDTDKLLRYILLFNEKVKKNRAPCQQ